MPTITTIYEPSPGNRVEQHTYGEEPPTHIYVVFFNNEEMRSRVKKSQAIRDLDAKIAETPA